MTAARTFRLFVSSTFSDFKAERAALQERVFPELEEFCRSRGATFQAIDLRWGITEEAQREHATMRICLEEVRRCQEMSPRPNFAALLGDRYGWEPCPARIPIDHWDRMINAASPSDCALIQAGYIGPDLNAIPPVYHLKERESSSAECEAAEICLREALRRAADAAGFNLKERVPYFASATHQEIALGALAEEGASGAKLNAEDQVCIYVRSIAGLPADCNARDFIDWDEINERPVEGAAERLRELKAQLRLQLPGRVRDFNAQWTATGIDNEYIEEFCQRFLEDQKAIILRQLQEARTSDEAQDQSAGHARFAVERARNFQGRSDFLDRIKLHLAHSITTNAPLLVHGAGGTGKSALLAKAYLDICEARHQGVIIARFIGGSPGADSFYDLVTNLTTSIARSYGQTPPPLPESLSEAQENFRWALKLSSSERPLILFIDALDQLNDKEATLIFDWLPKPIGHTKLVASMRSDSSSITSKQQADLLMLELPTMPQNEAEQMLQAWLNDTREALYNAGTVSSYGRALTTDQRQAILSTFAKTGKPLWLKLAYEEARSWPSWHGQDNPEVLKLPETIEGMVEDLINRRLLKTEKHPVQFTKRAIAYISGGRFGLSDAELGRALATDPIVRLEFDRQATKNSQDWKCKKHLPPIMWSRLYFDLQPYLAQSSVNGAILYRWFHREFKEAVEDVLIGDEQQRRVLHAHLAKTFSDLAPYGRRNLFHYAAEQQVSTLRCVMEEPWQLSKADDKTKLNFVLRDFGFILAKCAAGAIHDLEQDLTTAGMRSYATFIRSNKHVLGGLPAVGDWPKYRIMLQLALEEDASSGIFRSAQKWLSLGPADWNVAVAPAMTPRNTSLRIRPGGMQTESIQVCLNGSDNIVIMDENGLCQSYDGSDGSPLGACDIPAEFLARAELPKTPPGGMKLSRAWPVGNDRWFGWTNESRDGSAWLYDPAIGRWAELPRGHHNQVWFATGLPSGGFASLGLNANVGSLVVWPDDGHHPQVVTIPHGPRHDLDGNAPQAAGIVQLPDDGYLIWPFMGDGSGAYLKRQGGRGQFWRVYPLPGTEQLSGALSLTSVDGDVRFVTWSKNGEVRMWQHDVLPRPVMHKAGSRGPHRLGRDDAPLWDSLAGQRSVSSLYRAMDGTLYASDDLRGSIWKWEETFRQGEGNGYWCFTHASTLPEGAIRLPRMRELANDAFADAQSPACRKLADIEGIGPWEVTLGDKRGVWICGAADPLVFHIDGQRIFVTGNLSKGVRELRFLN